MINKMTFSILNEKLNFVMLMNPGTILLPVGLESCASLIFKFLLFIKERFCRHLLPLLFYSINYPNNMFF